MKVSVEKPGSPTDILEHHGVKGQKWGVRQRSQSAGYKAGKAAQRSSSFRARFPTSAQRTAEIHRARIQTHQDYINVLTAKSPAQREKLLKVHLNNPDRATALRFTRGEKVVAGILAGGLALPTAGVVPAALAGYTGTTLAIRKGFERGQRKRASQ